MIAMPAAAKRRYDELLRQARRSAGGDAATRWRALEDAHVLSQPWAGRHVHVHARMLLAAITEKDVREALGQVLRLVVAGPGSLSGRYPPGNTGRADVPATLPMAVRAELAALLPEGLRPETSESGTADSAGTS